MSDSQAVPNTISVLVKVARQVEGEYVFINILRAHRNADVLWDYVKNGNLPKTEEIDGVPCVVEYGIFTDIVVEGD